MPSYRLKPGDRAVIRRKVSAMHIEDGVRDVLRPFVRHARKAFLGIISDPRSADLWRKRTTRRAVYKEALREHARNRALYQKVMSGRF